MCHIIRLSRPTFLTLALFLHYLSSEDVVDRICEIHFHTIKNKKVECKKAQPKETVTPATQLQLQKRLLLSGLGLRMPTAVMGAGNPHAASNVMPTQLTAYPLAAHQVSAREFY
jgi:RNA-binding protein Musashi